MQNNSVLQYLIQYTNLAVPLQICHSLPAISHRVWILVSWIQDAFLLKQMHPPSFQIEYEAGGEPLYHPSLCSTLLHRHADWVAAGMLHTFLARLFLLCLVSLPCQSALENSTDTISLVSNGDSTQPTLGKQQCKDTVMTKLIAELFSTSVIFVTSGLKFFRSIS